MKGKVTVDAGFFYAPYMPVGVVKEMNWRELLDYYSVRQFDVGSTLPEIKLNPEKTVLDIAQESFQRRWPGNYSIVEYYNPTKGRFGLRLAFENPHEETMWLLRWS